MPSPTLEVRHFSLVNEIASTGSVTRAARTLGLTHQGLCYIINHRHQSLLSARAPIRVRRKPVIKKHK